MSNPVIQKMEVTQFIKVLEIFEGLCSCQVLARLLKQYLITSGNYKQ